MVPAVGVEISTPWRTGLIPDVVVLDVEPDGARFAREHVVLAAEVWSPGNTRNERETKIGAYAEAGIRFFWSVELGRAGRVTALVACRLEQGRYVEEVTAKPGAAVTITSAPVPITLDPAYLTPGRGSRVGRTRVSRWLTSAGLSTTGTKRAWMSYC